MNPQQFSILVVDDENDITELLQDILSDEGYQVSTANSAEVADNIYLNEPIDLVLLDIWMPNEDGISLLKRWYESGLKSQVIMMSGHGTIETAVQATKLGAFDFIEKPISMAKLMIAVENVIKKIKLEMRNKALIQQINPNIQLIGKSPQILQVKSQLEQIKNNPLPVTFLGDSGVGKTYYARYLHQISERAAEPFIIVNASSLKHSNQMQEIFGANGQLGLINTAEGGTLYVDEVSDLDSEVQSLFAILIEEGKYKQLGTQNYVSPSVRLCFASKSNLSELVKNEQLKSELYYQIQTLVVKVPCLKSYQDDIPEIINYYVYQFVDYDNLPYRHFSMPALNYLREYHWPGNVRELKNFIQRVLVLGEEEEVSLAEVEKLLTINVKEEDSENTNLVSIDLPIRDARERFEKAYFMQQLAYCKGNIAKLAERAGLERTNLYRKLKSLGIQYK